MRRLAKKVAATAMALTMTAAMATTCFAANWGSYFGANADWYEGAEGKLTANTAAGFTASINSVGWGGVWGAQVYIDGSRNDNAKNVKVQKENLTHFHLTSALQTLQSLLMLRFQQVKN